MATSRSSSSELAGEQKHYTTSEISEMWHLSMDTVRRLFAREPGVIVLESEASRKGKHKKHRTLRIPAQVVERVHRTLRSVA